MEQKDQIFALRNRFKLLFLAMAGRDGRAYAEGFVIGWLVYLARYDYSVIQKLRYLEEKYGISKDND
jgi:hypothetical protein